MPDEALSEEILKPCRLDSTWPTGPFCNQGYESLGHLTKLFVPFLGFGCQLHGLHAALLILFRMPCQFASFLFERLAESADIERHQAKRAGERQQAWRDFVAYQILGRCLFGASASAKELIRF